MPSNRTKINQRIRRDYAGGAETLDALEWAVGRMNSARTHGADAETIDLLQGFIDRQQAIRDAMADDAAAYAMIDRLRKFIDANRRFGDVSWSRMAHDIGVDDATLDAWRKGEDAPDADQQAAIGKWIESRIN